MGNFNVIVSTSAKDSIKKHTRFLANASVPASRRLLGTFGKAIGALSQTPFAFPVFYNDYRKFTVLNRYAFLYEVIGTEVFLDKIIDMRSAEFNNITLENENSRSE